jgi:hypothetical protein
LLRAGAFVQLSQHRLVATVQAIEITDGNRSAALAAMQIVYSAYQSHQAFENIEL